MNTSVFSFATDFQDEGLEQVLDNVQQRAGLDGVTLACSYHHARDVFPHNPIRKVRFLEGGAVFFRPELARYDGTKIKPQVSRLAAEVDVLAALVAGAERRGLHVRAWTVYLHNTTLGSQYPDCTVHNAFGDPYLTSLCPANPEVRAYVRALSADIARYGVQTILAEALTYLSFDHGYHHERSFIHLSPRARFMLGLCFCDHCLAAARARGVDGVAVQRFVRAELDRVFAGETAEDGDAVATLESLDRLVDGELGAFLATRQAVVTTLVAEATEAVRNTHGVQFTFAEMSGGAKGYATGKPAGDPAPTIAWQSGVDVAAVARASDALMALGYAFDPNRVRLDLAAYRALMPAGKPLDLAVRPTLPDCDSLENLAAKVRLARELGVRSLDFYHYGFMHLRTLDLIRQALAAGR